MVFSEFTNAHCFIKDKKMGLLVLKGTFEDGLYKLQIHYLQPPQWLVSSLATKNNLVEANLLAVSNVLYLRTFVLCLGF